MNNILQPWFIVAGIIAFGLCIVLEIRKRKQPTEEILQKYLRPLAELQTNYRLDVRCGDYTKLNEYREKANQIRGEAKATGIDLRPYGVKNSWGYNYEKWFEKGVDKKNAK